MMFKRGILVCIMIAATGVPANRSNAEIVVVEIPIASIAMGIHDFEIDLGRPVAQVKMITFFASGTCSAPSASALGNCVNPRAYPIEIFEAFKTASSYLSIAEHRSLQEGAFAIADTIVPGPMWAGLFQSGHETLSLEAYMHLYGFLTHDCAIEDWGCAVCADGEFVFDGSPVLTVEFEPAVPVGMSNWGHLKALFR